MGNIQHVNNASATMAAGITAAATVITVNAGQGALFPIVEFPSYAKLALEDVAGNIEIVHLTARSGDVLTVTRAQEGTTAKVFASGSRVENRITAATLNDFLQKTGDAVPGQIDFAVVPTIAGVSDFARLSVNNVFTGGITTLQGVGLVDLRLKDSTAALDEKIWAIRSSVGKLEIFTVTDAGAGIANVLTLDRTGVVVDSFTVTAPLINLTGQVPTIELGHASDTTLSRSAAGVLAVEGVPVPTSEFGTYIGTLTGCTTSPTGTVRYSRVGKTVTIFLPAMTGTSNSNACTITGSLPVSCRPTSVALLPLIVGALLDAGFGVDFCFVLMDANGVINLGIKPSITSFTPSGVKGIPTSGVSFSYLIN